MKPESHGEEYIFPTVMMYLSLAFAVACLFGMIRSCQDSYRFSKACRAAEGTVKWGSRGGDDLCFSKDGRLINIDQ